jgi:hypothetical protein
VELQKDQREFKVGDCYFVCDRDFMVVVSDNSYSMAPFEGYPIRTESLCGNHVVWCNEHELIELPSLLKELV